MKKSSNYYKIKWGSFFATALILTCGILIALLLQPKTATPQQPQEKQLQENNSTKGHYSNASFSKLIEETLSEYGFIDTISFEGKTDGRFSLSGTLSNPERLAAVCPDLKSAASVLSSLKGKKITINGHLGENERGYGQFVSDTISFSGLTLPAGIATNYIEQYTTLNALLEVPIQQISINEEGVHFANELPAVIQIASYNSNPVSPSEEGEQG
jgi:hypothetical protein